jgi:Fic family protein
MSYIEVIRRNGKEYFYATRNFRTASGKWRKVRKFLGPERPRGKKLAAAFAAVELEAGKNGFGPRPKYSYLDIADAEKLEDVKDAYVKWFGKLQPEVREKYRSDFLIRFTYNTNAIEGSRLSLRETAMIFKEGIVPAGAEVNDYNEALNSRDAFEFMKKHTGGLSRRFILKLHREITKNTKCRRVGEYRDSDVRISGSDWIPPPATEVPRLMERLFTWYRNHRTTMHPVELGAVVHTRMVQIHPFTDGNGRTARLVMNWILQKSGYPMLYIENRDKLRYYEAIEAADKGNLRTIVKYASAALIGQFTFPRKGD